MFTLAFRRSRRAGVLWGYVFAAFVASSALTYNRLYSTPAQRLRLAATFGANHAASALFGPAVALQTAAGFTTFKVSMSVTIIGSVWGLLIATRLLRSEEESGRWELVLSGPRRPGQATAATLLGLAASLVVVWVFTGAVSTLVGRSHSVRIGAGAAWFLALALVVPAVMFAAVGAVTSQLAPTRRRAAGYAAVILGASYALRMVADSGAGLHWLAWVSPLGWVELARPLVGSDPAPLLAVFAFTAVLVSLAVYLASARDVGAAVLPESPHAADHLALVQGPGRLTARLMRFQWLAWWAGIVVAGLLMGLVAKSAGATMPGSSVQQVLSRLGAYGSGAYSYLGVAFLLLGILVAFAAVSQIAAVRLEEAEHRLTNLLVAPVSRVRWYVARLLPAAVVVTVGGALSGAGAWAGAAASHAGVSLPRLLAAGLNVVPAAGLALGVGALAFGWRPRWTSGAAYAVLIWSVLVELLAGFVSAQSHWLLDTSVFHQVGAAPATGVDWVTDVVMAGLGAAGVVLGGLGFARRDLTED